MILKKASLVSILLAGLSASASIMDVDSLNQTLKKEKQRWTAKETWVNQLSRAEAKAMMGAPTMDSDVEFYSDDTFVQWGSLPRSVDWRNKNGKNWVSPILNQGACGSCVAFAAVGTLETQINISALMPSLNIQLSPQQLFSCGGGECVRGWYPDAAAQFLKKNGVVDQACMPYLSGVTGQNIACNQQCVNASSRALKISDYKKPTSWFKSMNALKKALQKGPLLASMTVYEDFMSYSSGVYKHVTGQRLGGHAISIIGYDDSKQALIIRNSWGPSWGDSGFGYVDYKDSSGIGAMTWSFELPAISSFITMEAPRDRDYVSGDVEFTSSNNVSSAAQVRYTIIKTDGTVAATQTSDVKETNLKIDTAALDEGKYQVMAEALESSGRVVAHSTYQYFYVVNKAPQLSVSFIAVDIDLTKPVAGRVEFEIFTKSSSVPMSSLEFHIKDASGKEIVRSTNTVIDDLRTGWNTKAFVNGQYEVWFAGRVKTNQIDARAETPHQVVTIKN